MRNFKWFKRAFALLLFCTATAVALPAQTFTSMHDFSKPDGMSPYAGMIQAADGNYYGTTMMGGNGGGNGNGTIFKMTPAGEFTALYKFSCPADDMTCQNGNEPMGALIQAPDGELYGTTHGVRGTSQGTVFKITLGGKLTTVVYFNGANGAFPAAGLIQATDGTFYGTTQYGGLGRYCGDAITGCGTIFRLTPSGRLLTIYSFCSQLGCTDGQYPASALVQGRDGSLYGTTYGDASKRQYGTIFRITSTGLLTTLHSFCKQALNCADGFAPNGLVATVDGNLYGTTQAGGPHSAGTIFRITPSGTLTTLYSFNSVDAAAPMGGALIQGTDGYLYGTSNGPDTIFKMDLSGKVTFLYHFEGATTTSPGARLLQSTDGSFFGTTYNGGANNEGSIFCLSTGLNPFVKLLTTFGKVGTQVRITGTDLTGAAFVNFNGTRARFTLVSSTLLTATVPSGATSGRIQVVLNNGPLSRQLLSDVPFRLLQ